MTTITPPPARPDIHDGEFPATLAGSAGPVVVAFSTAWCRPCRLMAPLLLKLVDEFALPAVALDAAAVPQSVRHYGVEGFPELLLFRDGALNGRVPGFRSYDELREALAAFAASAARGSSGSAERAFRDAATEARDAFEAAVRGLDAEVTALVQAVAPSLDAARAEVDRQVEAGLMTAEEGFERMRAAQTRAFLPFRDRVDAADDAEERALGIYDAAVSTAAERFAASRRGGRPGCADGRCRVS